MKSVGVRGELLVAQELMKRGWSISFPFGDNSYYDLIADRLRHICRIQVKCTERLSLNVGGHGPHYAFSLTHGTNVNKMSYDETMIDFFICCSIEGNRYWILPVKDVTTKTLKIFLDGQKYHEYEGAWDLLR